MSKKMKSAYELAMERLEKTSGPTKKLTDAQREEIARIDKVYEAKIAEARLEYEQKMASASSPTELDELQGQLAQNVAELEQEREKQKETIWEKA
ncbi:MAG: hypothetical protein R6V12_08180 [Candidatus Hydrogenedentota bacterium]